MVAVYITPCEEAREVWKPIPGWHGYEVSNMGRVRSYRAYGRRFSSTPHMLNGFINRAGYFTVGLCGARQSQFRVHRLVLLAFVGPSALDTLHHDGIKTNNRLSNLRYGTEKDNKDDDERLGRIARGERHGKAKLTLELVSMIRRRVAAGEPRLRIARELGMHPATVGRAACGDAWGCVPAAVVTAKYRYRRRRR